MKKITILSLLLFAIISGFVNAQSPVALGDPFIMLHEGTYYAYGTVADDGIAVFVSDDLKTWTVPDGAKNGLALHKDDVWADRWFWAPEVYFVNNRFYMYYSADEHICVATAHSPLGPFKQEVKKPMIENEKCIDNSLFIDDDGKPYLLFDRFNDGLNIWIAELESDLMTIKMETMKKCIAVSQPWEEVQARVNEGSFIVTKRHLLFELFGQPLQKPVLRYWVCHRQKYHGTLQKIRGESHLPKTQKFGRGGAQLHVYRQKRAVAHRFPRAQQQHRNPSTAHVHQFR
jgi:hypothetical protein